MTIQQLFPTSVYYEALEPGTSDKFNSDVLEECYKIQEVDDDGREWSKKKYVGGYTSYASYAELHRVSSTFEALQKKIDAHVASFVEHLEFDIDVEELQMTTCWINVMPAQTTHSMHIHPLSVISGTYYVHVPPGASGIKFEDPRLDKFMAAPPKRSPSKKRNKQIVEYKAKPGNVVLFESWLRHEVPASLAKDNRVSISFNYDWVG